MNLIIIQRELSFTFTEIRFAVAFYHFLVTESRTLRCQPMPKNSLLCFLEELANSKGCEDVARPPKFKSSKASGRRDARALLLLVEVGTAVETVSSQFSKNSFKTHVVTSRARSWSRRGAWKRSRAGGRGVHLLLDSRSQTATVVVRRVMWTIEFV